LGHVAGHLSLVVQGTVQQSLLKLERDSVRQVQHKIGLRE